jgi:para-nitrobenzyl esterase
VLRRHNLNHYFGEEPTSEDCLYLNIWAPAEAKPDAKLPVLVYIHGGGFTIGSSGMALYAGESVAKRDAVFVNFNYRLGALGFMAHPELTKESPHNASGNYGLLDQVAALRWIKSNIARFGGDPDNVTISGQSAGSSSVAFLQASPLAKGLLRRAVGFSGSPFANADPLPTRADAETAGLAIQETLATSSLSQLRELPADKIVAVRRDCQLGCAGSIRVGPSVDGYFLPDAPTEIFAAGRHNDVPLLIRSICSCSLACTHFPRLQNFTTTPRVSAAITPPTSPTGWGLRTRSISCVPPEIGLRTIANFPTGCWQA